jgi:diphthamide biosynthesis protein 7
MDVFGIFQLPGSQKDSLVLAFQWHPTLETTFGATLSTGEVMLVRLGCSFTAELNTKAGATGRKPMPLTGVTTFVMKHDLEAWTLAFTPSGKSLLSGGDDCALRFSTTSPHEDPTNPSLESYKATWSNRKIHGAGVTALLPLTESLYLTGSYDDHVRLIEDQSKLLAEENLGGGVWRLKLIDETLEPRGEVFYVLASCMHAGPRVLEVSRYESTQWRIKVLASFSEHKSMNYGSDWRLEAPPGGQKITVVSTSFYDKLICTWRYEFN